ncbi:MAG TPA: hypothetical protein VII45_01675 [Solirubrobacterales bacterium]
MPQVMDQSLSELPSFDKLDKRLTREWDIGASPARAVETARQFSNLLLLRASSIDLARDLKPVWHAAEVLWDSMEFDDAEILVTRWRKTVVSVAERQGIDPTEARIWSAILSAELEHRLRNYGTAVNYARAAMTEIRTLAGGEKNLRRALKLGRVTPVTEMHCAALAIAIPAARVHFAKRPHLRVQFLDRWIDDALLILDRDLPPPLLRVHALVIQTYYAIAELSKNDDRVAWLDRLERFDDLVRPRTLRGQKTKRLRGVARARFNGDGELEREEAVAAHRDLVDMPRHVKALTANGWWPRVVNQ